MGHWGLENMDSVCKKHLLRETSNSIYVGNNTMYLNLKFTVNVYEGLTQTHDARGSLFFNNFEITRGSCFGAFVFPTLLPLLHLHNYIVGH